MDYFAPACASAPGKPGGIEEENEMTLRMMDKYGSTSPCRYNQFIAFGESTLSVINPETLVPCSIWHMDVNARIKVLTRRVTIYRSELPDKNRASGPLPKYLQIRQFKDKTWLP